VFDDVAADETGAAGDQNSHASPTMFQRSREFDELELSGAES